MFENVNSDIYKYDHRKQRNEDDKTNKANQAHTLFLLCVLVLGPTVVAHTTHIAIAAICTSLASPVVLFTSKLSASLLPHQVKSALNYTVSRAATNNARLGLSGNTHQSIHHH